MSERTLGPAFAAVLGRELDRLARQIQAYEDEAHLWEVRGSAANAPGTLALHLAGNLEHFVGAVLGGSGYVRDRDAEFGDRNVPRAEILDRIAGCRTRLTETLAAMDDSELARPYPSRLPASMEGASSAAFLVHLTWHMGWHLGQVDYHRRLLYGGTPV